MIINNYLTEFVPHIQLSTIDLFLLYCMNRSVKRILTQETYKKNIQKIEMGYVYRKIKKQTEQELRGSYDKGKEALFSSIEIEIINRCNGECTFCPVNRYTDPRRMKKMDDQLFKKIIDELGDMDYAGRLALHSNNEPFLDDRIIEFAKYAREHVSKAFVYLYTNGTLVTLDKFKEIIPYLDKMIIDNYNDELKLDENVEKIYKFCRSNKNLNKKVEIHIRKANEVLYTRGGLSPNNKKRKILHMSCILPYRQMVIRPDGKTSLCCNDPYGTNTMADLNQTTLKEAWYSERYERVRNSLRKGRKYINRCRYCDTLLDPKVY